jgi:hyperosmotically inducible periplasmic protein
MRTFRVVRAKFQLGLQSLAIALRGTFFLLLLASVMTMGVATSLGSSPQTPDNAAANKPGTAPDATRADQQGLTTNDRELTRKIRKAVIADKSLSTYAHNVKIISRNGVVTLKGPVRSDDEKKAVNSAAIQIAGAANVKDELTVKP